MPDPTVPTPSAPATIALIDSGKGLLPTARWLARLVPGARLLLCSDPDGSPWGEREPADVIGRVIRLAQQAIDAGAQAIVLACNTASVTALPAVRARFEPGVPVIGTVPAVKPAAERCDRFAVWATQVTARSDYLRGLLDAFAAGERAGIVGSPDLAEAIQDADDARIDAAIAGAAARTPAAATGVVLGCTHYPLVADRIQAALPGVQLFDSSGAVARQTLRRLGLSADAGAGDAGVELDDPLAAVGAVDEPVPGATEILLGR